MSVDYLDTLADALLDAAEGALVLATTGHAAPSHAWVSHGEPAVDHACDGGQVTVHLVRLFHDPPFGQYGAATVTPQKCHLTPQATFEIQLWRCVPTLGDGGESPPTADMDTSAGNLLTDLWAILTEIYDRFYAETLFGDPTLCRDVTIGEVAPLGPEGGAAGWSAQVTVVCNDPGPTGS